jgi:anti-sigma28 factor (negative regulator of flagellin synthesis)
MEKIRMTLSDLADEIKEKIRNGEYRVVNAGIFSKEPK